MALQHPLVYDVPYFPQLNARLNQMLAQKQVALTRGKKERNWQSYVWLHERPWRMEALLGIKKQITDDAVYWQLVSDVWIDPEDQWQWGDRSTRQLFNRPQKDLMMTPTERDTLAYLPDSLTVYRGIHGNGSRSNGWSWTIDRDRAEWFANRWQASGRELRILSALAHKSDVIAYLDRRGESEIVIDPRSLQNIEELETLEPESQTLEFP
jgi:hypothetical protein